MAMAGALFSIVGTVIGTIGSLDQAAAAKKAEAARQQQMNLEAQRQRREQVRQAIAARATPTSRAYNQGAGTSSALAGGLAQISGQAGRNVEAINQDQQLGNKIFDANKDYASASGLIALGNGVSSFGGSLGGAFSSFQKLGFA